MILNKRRIVTFLLAQLFFLASINAQLVCEMKFAGKLADLQGEAISEEEFKLSVEITREGNSTVLFEMDTIATSDQQGWFGYTISDISPYLYEEGKPAHALVLKMEVLPSANTEWIGEGEEFLVTYTLKPDPDSTDPQLRITRLEGSTLVKHSEEHLLAFKDQDPFAYVQGGFLITDAPPVQPESMSDLKLWLSPEEQDAQGGASRGVKGGFPKGGYKNKK